jgi:group I intron endonuclease
MKHYVYKLTESITNEFYYGVRTCECNPNTDSYMGSMIAWKPNKDNLIKEIISEFNSREEAVKFESNIIRENIQHPLNRNYHTGVGMAFYGKSHSNETKEKVSNTMNGRHVGKDNPFYGRKHTSETLKKMSDSLQGGTHSDETKKKMSESATNINRSGYKLKRKKVLHIESGVVYISIYMAAKELGMNRSTIRKYMDDKFKLV